MLKKLLLVLIIISYSVSYSQIQKHSPSKIISAVKFDKTPPLRSIPVIEPGTIISDWREKGVPNKDGIKKLINPPQNPLHFGDPVVQTQMGELNPDSPPINNWEGISNINGVYPPDTQGDVGPNHYIQMVNLSFQIWAKSGTNLYGPVANSTLWNGFGDPWDGSNDGDPIILYDETADRWMFSQFALPNYPSGPFYILIAITETGDPLGAWYRYGFEFTDMPDYPKFAIWPDGIYMTINEFSSGSLNWAGVGVAVFERDLMLAGNPNARMVYWNLSASDDPWSMLPSDFDGLPPPLGTPNYMVYFNDNAWGYPTDHLRIFECSVNWNTPTSSTLTGPTILDTNPFDSGFSNFCPAFGNCNIQQQGTNQRLDALSSRLLFRLQYRNFGSYQTLVTNHTVDVATNQAGVRWYELRKTGSSWSLYQQGTYAPDTHNRWMGSIAMDGYGNIGLGYSVSSSSVYPSIRYVGRYKNDPLGLMTISEQTIISGSGYQSGQYGRWGDYSMVSADPTDDATFWYTTEYIQTTGTAPWRTRVASFTFGFDLNIKVFLEGSYVGASSMSTYLNSSGYLPEQQPFNSSPWNYDGIEKVFSDFFSNNTNIVDWVLVQLRTGSASSTIVAQRAGLLRNDGVIVGLDGSSPLRFGLPAGNYYIVVSHRNHLSIMSSNTVTINSYPPVVLYDFTTAMTQAYTIGPAPMVDLGGGVYGAFSADSDGSGTINAVDRSNSWNERNLSGYFGTDVDLSGTVNASDRSLIWNNRNLSTQVP